MFPIESIALIAFVYIFILFLIAYFGDSDQQRINFHKNSNLVYALSLAVYCSSWTFYGAVGTAAVDGMDYLAIYLGPILFLIFGYPMMRRIIMICKQNSITSISDFISSRFGKSRRIGVLVTCIAVVGSLPYIALQLKAVSSSYLVLGSHIHSDGIFATGFADGSFLTDNVAFITGIALATFTILFGTRHLDATEHHQGLILAISFESIVKLVAILAVGYYAVYLLMDHGAHQSFGQVVRAASFDAVFANSTSTWTSFVTKTLLSMGAIFLLPRQFQVAIVEAKDHRQFKTAMWVMPIYLVLTSVIVFPIALSGGVLLPDSEADLYMLLLPLTAGNESLAMLAFIGGLSAATGMVIVAAISLSTMVCNDLVMPYLIAVKRLDILNRDNLDGIILTVRRLAIVALILGAYGYYVLIDSNAQLANIGLVSFAAIAQLLPAMLAALYWRRAHSRGVFWGLCAGFAVWAYTLMLPMVLSDEAVIQVFGESSWLHPQGLFGMQLQNSLTHGVYWSLTINICLLVWFSLREDQPVLEKIQASRFFFTGDSGSDSAPGDPSNPYSVHPESLRVVAERIIGVRNTNAVFQQYQQQAGVDLATVTQVDRKLISLVQTAIAGVIGSASAQKVISDTLLGNQEYLEEATSLVDEASTVLQFNRNLLQTALQNITHGISVVDDNLNLVVWNDRYIELFDYPDNLIYVGKPIEEVLNYSADRGDFAGKDAASEIRKRLRHLQKRHGYESVRKRINGRVIKAIGEPMPNGGFVTTYEDITETVKSSEMLRVANEELESRVQERTHKLEELTKELESTTLSKTHFLAAASHDLLQPINAARLFAHSVSERSSNPDEVMRLAESIDQSLVTANQLLRALLDVSKLDSGGIKPEPSDFSLREFVFGLALELEPSANDKKVNLRIEVDDLYVNTDRQLLLSVLQNLATNALRYTPAGGEVLIKAQTEPRDAELVVVSVIDTGEGISEEHLSQIFNEFYQIKKPGKKNSSGLGLGLSIVKRISKLLDLSVQVESVEGEGSTFSLKLNRVENLQTPTVVEIPPTPTNYSDRLHNLRVLCLDNDESVLSAMLTLLEGWGCTVDMAETYQQGVTLLKEQSYDVVLADYSLDYDETGLDFLRSVGVMNESAHSAQMQGVLITAEQDKNLVNEANALGFQYLAKPIEPAALKSLLLFFLTDD